MKKKIIYQEQQFQRQFMPWALIIIIWTLVIWEVYQNWGTTNQLVFDIIVLILLPLVLTLLLYFANLEIIVSPESLNYKYFPFHLHSKIIAFDQIQNIEIREYNRDRAFHGWGFGISFSKRVKSYTIAGYRGIEINLIDKTRVFIGAKEPEKIKEIFNNRQKITTNL